MASAAETLNQFEKRKRPASGTPRQDSKKRRLTSSSTTSGISIEALEAQISRSQRHYNNIVTLLDLAKVEVKLSKIKVPALLALCRSFCRLQADGRLSKSNARSEKALVVAEWLKDRYVEFKELLCRLVAQPESAHREIVFALALQLVREECSSVSSPESAWKSGLYFQVLVAALSVPQQYDTWGALVDRFAQEYDDVRHYTFYAVDRILRDSTSQANAPVTTNSLALLSRISPILPTDPKQWKLFCEESRSRPTPLVVRRKQAQQTWMALLNAGLDKEQRKTVLGIMTYRVVPWFQNVELLMDFLTDSYDFGGATSLLALSGLFYLVQERNLDYPDFFIKLYSLLDDELMFSKHRSRFFRLLNTFMSSTHLPAALVASFVKKLSRLALHAPPAGIVAVIPWVYNMLKNHPACTFMIHRETRTVAERQQLGDEGAYDPFDDTEKDPMETSAIDSCLWELVTLQTHYHPNVASLARIISEQFTKVSYTLEDFLDHSYGTLIASELSRDLKKTPVVEHEIPKTIFRQADGNDTLHKLMTSVISVDS